MQKKFITCAEAAALANVTTETIRNLCKRGVLDYRMSGNFFLPAESDVKKHVRKISEIHRATQDIRTLRDEVFKEQQEVQRQKQQLNEQLILMGMYPRRIFAIYRTLVSYVRHFHEETGELNPREVDVICQFLDGKSANEIGYDLGITSGRVTQIWDKALRRFRVAKTEYRDMRQQIAIQQDTIQSLEEEIAVLRLGLKDEKDGKTIAAEFERVCSTRLGECELSIRALNCLKHAEKKTIRDLYHTKYTDLLRLRNFGKKSLTELYEFLEHYNLTFGMDDEQAFNEWKLKRITK